MVNNAFFDELRVLSVAHDSKTTEHKVLKRSQFDVRAGMFKSLLGTDLVHPVEKVFTVQPRFTHVPP